MLAIQTLPRDFAYELYHKVISKYNGGWLSGGIRKEIVLINPSMDKKIPELSEADFSNVSKRRHYMNMLSRLASKTSHKLSLIVPQLKEMIQKEMTDKAYSDLLIVLCVVGVCLLLSSALHLEGAEHLIAENLEEAVKNSVKVASSFAGVDLGEIG